MKKILVIEDEHLVRESIRDLLELEGFQTLVAADGNSGLELAKENLPDLILCDVQMPNMNGYDVLTRLYSDPSTNTIPFIFLTARGTKLDQRYGMDLGADDYLTKPCTAEQLLSAIASRLSKQSTLQTRTQRELDTLRSSIALSLPHELRTPITSILSSVELLRMLAPDIDSIQVLEITDTIEEATHRLYRLVQNYLLYTQLELTARDPERLQALHNGTTHCCDLTIWETATDLARRTEREADLHLQVESGSVSLDPSNFRKVILELLDNAFKFSKRGTPVSIRGKLETDQYRVEISNLGRGMTAAQIERCGAYLQFDRQFHEQQGIGLGLAIARRLLELHHGSLLIDSKPNEKITVLAAFPIRSDREN